MRAEIKLTPAARYYHRLHAVLLVAQGASCPQTARLLGVATGSVENWVRRFELDGLTGLEEGKHTGRPTRLTPGQIAEVQVALQNAPPGTWIHGRTWSGKALAEWIEARFNARLSVRQCQRIIQEYGPDSR